MTLSISVPSIAVDTLDYDLVPTNQVSSTFYVRGAIRPPYRGTGPKFYLEILNSQYKYISLIPTYEGELFYSYSIANPNGTYTYLGELFQLYVAIRLSGVLQWVPVQKQKVAKYIDPSTGKEWDPLGAYTCNPTYLCA